MTLFDWLILLGSALFLWAGLAYVLWKDSK